MVSSSGAWIMLIWMVVNDFQLHYFCLYRLRASVVARGGGVFHVTCTFTLKLLLQYSINSFGLSCEAQIYGNWRLMVLLLFFSCVAMLRWVRDFKYWVRSLYSTPWMLLLMKSMEYPRCLSRLMKDCKEEVKAEAEDELRSKRMTSPLMNAFFVARGWKDLKGR